MNKYRKKFNEFNFLRGTSSNGDWCKDLLIDYFYILHPKYPCQWPLNQMPLSS